MCFGAVRFMRNGWIERLYVEPQFHFKYLGFAWVNVPGEVGLYLLNLSKRQCLIVIANHSRYYSVVAHPEFVIVKSPYAVAAFAALALSAPRAQAACEFEIEVGDALAYSLTEIAPDATCENVSVTITHKGTLPAAAMGHNWVLAKPDDFTAVTNGAMAAGLDANYVPDDERVIAATKIVGGGEQDTVTFPLKGLEAGEYAFFCTFPGHWSVMKGTFKVS
ncbi:MAG: azurin, partial [Pseudomonadota bacterium]